MEKLYCPYCGKPLTEGCFCEDDARLDEEDYKLWVEELEERQHKSGMYVQEDLIASYRFER